MSYFYKAMSTKVPSSSITIYMDFQYSAQTNQEVFRLFSNGLSNQTIHQTFPHLRGDALQSIIEVEVELVIGQIQTIFTTKFSFQKDSNYDKRRQQVIRQISSTKRLVFGGSMGNRLGENSMNHFFRICKYYMRYGNLNNYNYKIIHKLFKKWLSPHNNRDRTVIDSTNYELSKKKRHMQKLKIEHDILIKKSLILTMQEEIQALEESLKAKDKPCKLEEQQEQEQIQHSIEQHKTFSTLKQINSNPTQIQQNVTQSLIKQQATTLSSIKQQARKQEKGREMLKWTRQEDALLISLLQKYTIRDQANLLAEMQEKFGKEKFTPYTLRDKKYEMLRVTRQKCLLAIKNRSYLSQEQFKPFANHFMAIDNIHAFKFISKFLHKYYFCNFQALSVFAFKEIIDEVLQQETKVLLRGNTSKIIKQLLPTKTTTRGKEQIKAKMQAKTTPLNPRKGIKLKSQLTNK